MTIGKLNIRGELWRRARVSNGIGGHRDEEMKVTDLWAGLDFMEHTDFTANSKHGTELLANVLIRKYELDHDYFFVLDGERYEIRTIDQRRLLYTSCLCARSGAHV